MKYPVMLLILSVLAVPVLEAAPAPATPGECMAMYRQNLNELETGHLQSSDLMNYADRCMPKSANSDGLHYYKRLQITDDDKSVFTVQA